MSADSEATVVLTGVGAAGQVGEVVAAAFAALGASLVLVDRTEEHVRSRAADVERSGGRAKGYACDLTDEPSVDTLVRQVRAEHGDRIAALVHMAGGFAMSGPVAESDAAVWQRQIAINLTTAYLTSRAFLPMLRQARGAIVFFASEAALPGASVANKAAYSVAKAGVVTLMRAIAAEERKNGVRANAIAPTSIRTGVNVAAMGADVHYVEREQVADVVTYLCSPRASAVNGALIPLP
jgi:NAD(P)-dependent dehydrogenase (short-subunit alcohol dehydrogenase family)